MPPFKIPKDKLPNCDESKFKKGKNVSAYLESKKSLPMRKDLNPKWDDVFWYYAYIIL